MISFIGYFVYAKYLKQHIEIVELTPEKEEYKRRPDEPGGIKIANSESLVYDNLSSNNRGDRAIKITSQVEKPILFKKLANNDSVDCILSDINNNKENIQKSNNGELELNPEPVYELDIIKSSHISQKNINKIIDNSKETTFDNRIKKDCVGYWIELSAVILEDMAKQEWCRIQKKFSKYLKNKDMVLEKVQARDGSYFFLILAGSFDNFNKAQMACRNLIHQKQNCLVVPLKFVFDNSKSNSS